MEESIFPYSDGKKSLYYVAQKIKGITYQILTNDLIWKSLLMYIYNLLKTMVNEKQNHQPIEGCIQNRTKKKKKKHRLI